MFGSDGSAWAAWRRLELPTWGLTIVVYGSWLALTWFYAALPWWIVLAAGGWIIAWHMSLQHEIVHGHPTRSRPINTMLGFPPLSLWLPFERYRAVHLAHHNDPILTDPIDDPESGYLTRAQWERLPVAGRVLVRINNTLAGRILIGPVIMVAQFLCQEVHAVARGVPGARRIWSLHLLGIGAVLLWTIGICGIPLWAYLVLFVCPGLSLTLVRSFAEHRAAELPAHRTAIVENAPVLGLLFLYNNLHVAHHAMPGLPWFALPQYYKANRVALVQQNNGLVYDGYRDIACRYFFTQHDVAVHPLQQL